MFVVCLDERFESSVTSLPSDTTSITTTVGVLGVPKPKLAPIASCETLTDSYDMTYTALSGSGTESSSSVESSPPRLHSVSDDGASPPPPPAVITIISSGTEQQQQQQQQPRCVTTTSIGARRLQLPTTTTLLQDDELSIGTSSDTLVPGSPGGRCSTDVLASSSSSSTPLTATTPTLQSASGLKRSLAALLLVNFNRAGGDAQRKTRTGSSSPLSSHQLNALALSPATSPKLTQSPISALRRLTSPPCDAAAAATASAGTTRRATSPSPLHRSPVCSPKLQRASSPISYSYSSPNIITNMAKSRGAAARTSILSFTYSNALSYMVTRSLIGGGRISSVARSSPRPSVCIVRAFDWKTNKAYENAKSV